MNADLLTALAAIAETPAGEKFATGLEREVAEFRRLSEARVHIVRRAIRRFRRPREVTEDEHVRQLIITTERELYAEFVYIDDEHSVVGPILEET